jgi:hypothetical protein
MMLMKLGVEEEIPRPDKLSGFTYQKSVACGHLFITINDDPDGRPFEVFIILGKGGLCKSCMMNAIAMLVSHDLQKGLSLNNHIKILSGMRCDKAIAGMNNHGTTVLSCADGVSQVFTDHLDKKCLRPKEGRILCWRNKDKDGRCPDCDSLAIGSKVTLVVDIGEMKAGSLWAITGMSAFGYEIGEQKRISRNLLRKVE